MDQIEFNLFILSKMPHFIAINYQTFLEAETPQERIKQALHVYNLVLRALTISLVSQYLIKDKERISDSYLNKLLLEKFPRLTLDTWQQLFFSALGAYKGYRELFFMPELYDFYWNSSKNQSEIEQPFKRLTQISIEMKTEQLFPQDENTWGNLENEVITSLQQILQEMRFISNYDLIRILHIDELWYDFELHKGLQIAIGKESLPEGSNLTCGWFYMRKETQEFLPLQPFLVFWEVEEDENSLIAQDTGVYDRFIYAKLQYLLATLGKTVVDDKRVIEFIALLYETIEEAKYKRQKVEKLTWLQLRDICAKISEDRMATVWDKYHSELYLQRNKARAAFDKFLNSPKKCFVLIGESGIGKSNFILALSEELKQFRCDNTCVLMYDGAHLEIEPSITEIISKDFDLRVSFANRHIENIWLEINQIDEIEEQLVILYIDAINENPYAKELLKQVDELLQQPWQWLKIVVSSRPETWQGIRREVKLSEAKYYREKESESALGVELEPFNYSEQLEPFSRQEELPIVFAKYQHVFNLQTEYNALSNELRDMLCDPLNLWLVANTYQGKAIPTTLKSTKLIEQYIQTLLNTNRLHEDDLRLLEEQLIPLMLKEKSYRNAITIADIDSVGGKLYEVIYSEQILTDGRRVNQSFINLLDAGILARQTEGRNQKIVFKYERFYDYFAGKHLFNEFQKSSNKVSFIEKLIDQLKEKLFLWGGLQQLLDNLLRKREYSLIERFGSTNDEFQAELLINALIEYYPQDKNSLKLILQNWLERKYKKTLAPIITTNIAIDCRIEDILENLLVHPNEKVRLLIVQNIHNLWEINSEMTTKILHILPKRFKWSRPKRSLNILHTLFHASVLLTSRDYYKFGSETPTIRIVHNLWKPIIKKLLVVSRIRFIESIRKRIRRFTTRIGVGIVVKFAENAERKAFSYSFKDAETLLPASKKQKQIFKYFISHFDAAIGQTSESVEALTAYIEELARNKEDNSLIVHAALLGLIAHSRTAPLRTAQALEKLVEKLERVYPPTEDPTKPTASVWLAHVTAPFINFPYVDMMQQNPEETKQILKIHKKVQFIREFRYLNRFRFGCGDTFHLGGISNSLFGYHFDLPEIGCDMLKEIVQFQISRNDYEKILWEIPSLAKSIVRYKMPEAGMEALYDFIQILRQTGYLEKLDDEKQKQFWKKAANSLITQAEIYRPYLLDFLERFKHSEIPESFTRHIRSSRKRANIGYYTGEAATFAFREAIVNKNPRLRNALKWFFCTISEVRNVQELMLETIIYFIESVYGEKPLFSKASNPYYKRISA